MYLCRVRKLEGVPDDVGVNAPWTPLASQLIIDIASAAAGERDLDQILHETLDRLRTAMPLTGGSIALVQGDELVIRAAIGPFADEALGQRVRRGPGLSWRVVETLEPCLLPDMRASEAVIRGPKARQAIRSWLAVPIVRRGLGIGLLEIDSTQPNAFSSADMELLETIVRVLSGPVELADHYAAEQRANQLRDAFIGVISHELRTPITTIYGLSKMLRQRGADLDPEVMVSTIEDVEAEADRLQRLVEDLLVLSRAERGAMDIEGEPLGMVRILRRVVEAERARMPGTGHRAPGERRPATRDGRGDVRRAGGPKPPDERSEILATRGTDRGRGRGGQRGSRDEGARRGDRPRRRRRGPRVRTLLSVVIGNANGRRGRHRAVRLPPASRGDGWPDLGRAAVAGRHGGRVRLAGSPRG